MLGNGTDIFCFVLQMQSDGYYILPCGWQNIHDGLVAKKGNVGSVLMQIIPSLSLSMMVM